MSYVGQSFDYDVFVSYSHALKETESPEMQEWSRYLAQRLRTSLATALNTSQKPDRYFRLFIDEKGLASGDLLSGALELAVRKSAVLLIIMHPLYCEKDWCLRELRWFLDQANRDGRGVKYCQIVVAQPTEPKFWPKELVDESGSPALYLDFSAPDEGVPFGFLDRGDTRFLDLLPHLHMEILFKLKNLRKRLDDRPDYLEKQSVGERITKSDDSKTGKVFISFASADKKLAQSICAHLEERPGFRCWISSRDLRGGETYAEAIANAITSAKVLVVVFTARANSRPENIINELELANQSDHKVVVIPLRAENVRPTGGLAYHLLRTHWIDYFDEPAQSLQTLSDRIAEIVPRG